MRQGAYVVRPTVAAWLFYNGHSLLESMGAVIAGYGLQFLIRPIAYWIESKFDSPSNLSLVYFFSYLVNCFLLASIVLRIKTDLGDLISGYRSALACNLNHLMRDLQIQQALVPLVN